MRKLKDSTECLSIRVPNRTAENLRRIAASDDRSLNWIVAKILQEVPVAPCRQHDDGLHHTGGPYSTP